MCVCESASASECECESASAGVYLGAVQQGLPAVLQGQVGLLVLVLPPGVLVEGELPWHLGQAEQLVGAQLVLELLPAVQLLPGGREGGREGRKGRGRERTKERNKERRREEK